MTLKEKKNDLEWMVKEFNKKSFNQNLENDSFIENIQPNYRTVSFLDLLEKIKEKTNELVKNQKELEDLYNGLDLHSEEILTRSTKLFETQKELEYKNQNIRFLQNQIQLLSHKLDLHENKINDLQDEIERKPLRSISSDNKTVRENHSGKLFLNNSGVKKQRDDFLIKQLEPQQKLQETDVIKANLEKKQIELEKNFEESEHQNQENNLLQDQIKEINEEIENDEEALSLLKTELKNIKTQLLNTSIQDFKSDDFISLLQNQLQKKDEEINMLNIDIETRNDLINKVKGNKTTPCENISDEGFKQKYYTLKKSYDKLEQAIKKLNDGYEL